MGTEKVEEGLISHCVEPGRRLHLHGRETHKSRSLTAQPRIWKRMVALWRSA